jgi:hypothetical protein
LFYRFVGIFPWVDKYFRYIPNHRKNSPWKHGIIDTTNSRSMHIWNRENREKWWLIGGAPDCCPAVADSNLAIPTLLDGGRDFSVVYNTWRGFFSLYNYSFNCIF